MQGLMQDYPLTLPHIFHRVERLFPDKEIVTALPTGRGPNLLRQRGVEQIEEIRIDLHADERARMMEMTGRRTVPQIFINAHHVGGCDDLHALEDAGKLDALLAE